VPRRLSPSRRPGSFGAGVAKAERLQVLAFRLGSHNLIRPLPLRFLAKAAAACGIQETPLGSAALAFAARVDKLTPEGLERALRLERSLVTLWAMRGAPYVVPANDTAPFTTGALPTDAASFTRSMGGWSDALQRAGLDPFDTLDRMATAAKALLDGRTMNVNELRDAIYERVPSLATVRRPSFARDPMPEPLFRALGTMGSVCIVAGRGTDAELARTDQWLKDGSQQADPKGARAELVRRFLHCYGPATAQSLAEWTERSPADARDAFASIEDETIEMTVGRDAARLLARDERAFSSPQEARGVRLLPNQDPYLQQRDRATLLPKETDRRKLWQPVRGPGGVLVDGELVATWRVQTRRERLHVSVEPLGRLSRTNRGAIEAEAARLALFRGRDSVELAFGS
jgi:Winged helix DNA-binding domain